MEVKIVDRGRFQGLPKGPPQTMPVPHRSSLTRKDPLRRGHTTLQLLLQQRKHVPIERNRPLVSVFRMENRHRPPEQINRVPPERQNFSHAHPCV